MTYYINPDSGGVVRFTGPAARLADTNFHPVIVLDPEGDGPEQMVELVEAYRDTKVTPGLLSRSVWRDVLTEYARPEPPEPEEPTGYLARVRDGEGDEWHRVDGDGACQWIHRETKRFSRAWHELPRPITVLSEGVDD